MSKQNELRKEKEEENGWMDGWVEASREGGRQGLGARSASERGHGHRPHRELSENDAKEGGKALLAGMDR